MPTVDVMVIPLYTTFQSRLRRLDAQSEGLLLLTTSGPLSRALELPSSGLVRRYVCRKRAIAPATASQEVTQRVRARSL